MHKHAYFQLRRGDDTITPAVGPPLCWPISKAKFIMSRSCIYPLLKRVTHWPQAWLGLAINFGAVVSWLQVEGTADYALLITTLASLWW